MKDSYYIVFNQSGVDRMMKRQPSQLSPGEFAQQVELEVDDEIFHPVRVPKVTIRVDRTGVARYLADVGEEVQQP